MQKRGLLVAIEGNEGSGKSTQARRLANAIERDGHHVTLVHEPGSTPLGDHLRAYLKEKHPIVPTAELLLFAAARAQLVETVIAPALAQGTHVVADRFLGSSVAYQGYGRRLDLHMINQVNAAATSGLTPDITIWLDIDPAHGIARADADARSPERRPAARRFEDMPLDFHLRVAQGYYDQSTDPTWHRLDAHRGQEAIAQDALDIFRQAAARQATAPHTNHK